MERIAEKHPGTIPLACDICRTPIKREATYDADEPACWLVVPTGQILCRVCYAEKRFAVGSEQTE